MKPTTIPMPRRIVRSRSALPQPLLLAGVAAAVLVTLLSASSGLRAQVGSFDECAEDLCRRFELGTSEFNTCLVSCYTIFGGEESGTDGGGTDGGASSGGDDTPAVLPFEVRACLVQRCRTLDEESADYQVCLSECYLRNDFEVDDIDLDGINNALLYCGDGNLQSGEECDDGNRENKDGCSASCDIELLAISQCGNAILERNEECDDGNRVDGDSCSNSCRKTNPNGAFCFTEDGAKTTRRGECGSLQAQRRALFGELPIITDEDLLETLRSQFTGQAGAGTSKRFARQWESIREVILQALDRLEPLASSETFEESPLSDVVEKLKNAIRIHGENFHWSPQAYNKAVEESLIALRRADQVLGPSVHASAGPSPEEMLNILGTVFQRLPGFLQLFTSSVAGDQEDADRLYEAYNVAREGYLAARTVCAGDAGTPCREATADAVSSFESMRWTQPLLERDPQVKVAVELLFADIGF
jgi:cysteine-rich repeat protein